MHSCYKADLFNSFLDIFKLKRFIAKIDKNLSCKTDFILINLLCIINWYVSTLRQIGKIATLVQPIYNNVMTSPNTEHKNHVFSSLPPVVCRSVEFLFMIFVFVCV